MTKIQEFDYSVNLLEALLWQYNSATRLQFLLSQKNFWYIVNQQNFWEDWYTNVFNLQTANLFGLAVWSYILNIPLFIEVTPDPLGKPLWGFNEIDGSFPSYINTYENFDNGNFTTRGSVITLTEEEQRLILRLRYYQLVSRGATPDTNQFLSVLFKNYTPTYPEYGIAYVLDGLDMTITYVFNFNLSQAFRYIFQYYDILPRPAGVKIKYIILDGDTWGFNEIDGSFPDYININQNFENGDFIAEFL
jgi:hypothetical protein